MLEVYPLGKAVVPGKFEPTTVDAAINSIAVLPRSLRNVVEGCGDLDHPIRDGAWSIRALTHHIADSHMNAFIRLKLALTEELPTVKSYDEVAWSRQADAAMGIGVSLDLVDALHSRWVELLKSLTPAEFERPWQSSDGSGPRPAWRIPITYAWHGEHHVAQIRQAREFYGL